MISLLDDGLPMALLFFIIHFNFFDQFHNSDSDNNNYVPRYHIL